MTLKESEIQKNVLIALLKDLKDEEYLNLQKWYRIPASSKLVPLMVRNNTIKYIAFYLPKKFGNLKYSIPWFAEVKQITKVPRKELIYQKGNKKNDELYYKIEINKLEELQNPIYARRPRRIIFITTTENKFKTAIEINDLFYESPIEEKLWSEFKKNKIQAERQWYVKINNFKTYILDFAVFCKKGKINIECDGDEFHNSIKNINKDKERNNLLTSKQWQILRFNTDQIMNDTYNTLDRIMETINTYGGIEEIDIKNNTKKYRILNKYGSQDELFDNY